MSNYILNLKILDGVIIKYGEYYIQAVVSVNESDPNEIDLRFKPFFDSFDIDKELYKEILDYIHDALAEGKALV
jgi:protein-tyrosine phosphatase